MDDIDHIKSHDQFAATYDSQVKQYHSYGHDVLFGLCYEFVKPGQTLLDLGIGTGLSSRHFARVGLEVTGLDGSPEMLNECRKKGFAKQLDHYNIQNVPLPFTDDAFSHVICCGVFHFFEDLEPLFTDIARILSPSGTFGFTIASPDAEDRIKENIDVQNFIKTPSAWGIPIIKHTNVYIEKISDHLGFTVEKEQKVLADSGNPESPDILFKAIVMKKQQTSTK